MWTTRREWAADPPTTPSISHALAALPAPQCIPVFEYHLGDELVNHPLELPPCSNFGGKFAITTDPSVGNGMRAQIFADQLREQGVPISERHSASRTQGTMHVHMLVFPCRCEDGCQGRFLVSVGDNTTHPYVIAFRATLLRYHVAPPPFLASDPLVSYQGNVSSHLLELDSSVRRYHEEKRLSRQEAEECLPRTWGRTHLTPFAWRDPYANFSCCYREHGMAPRPESKRGAAGGSLKGFESVYID
ncbi:hypothetical protein EDB85DRAFT_2156039 [Lactarius pseudohatsudake]|nr:hypothetical protein EDB85DRAFT_2156039 [Lactarius pseudohatsudake]